MVSVHTALVMPENRAMLKLSYQLGTVQSRPEEGATTYISTSGSRWRGASPPRTAAASTPGWTEVQGGD